MKPTLFSKLTVKGLVPFLLLALYVLMPAQELFAQNVFSGEPVQWVGRPNGYNTEPYNADYRTTVYRKVSTTDANPTDGRGQWSTTINVQTTGGDIAPDNMPGGAGAGWLLISGPSGNRFQNKWNFSGVGQGAINSINNVTLQGGGEDMGLDMSTAGYYTFNMRDAGYVNTEFFVGYTASAPITVSRASETLNTGTNGTTINITTSAAPSTGENIYVRYSVGVNDFSGSTVVIQAAGSGTSWSAEIPSQDCGTAVYYYVYSSTRAIADINTDSESDRSLAAIRYDDNAGANYTYSVASANILASGGANGTINPTGNNSVNCGDDATFTITANSCYSIEDVLVDGVSQGAVATYTFTNVQGNHTISASFVINSFNVNATAGTGGTITPSGSNPVNCGSDASFDITPDACYSIADVLVDGVSVGAVTSYTISNVTDNHTIAASFVQTPYTIVVTQGTNGTISPGSGTANCGDDATYTITPDPCYAVQNVIVDGVPVGAVTSFTFTNVQEDHAITATFEVITYTITAVPGANGSITPAGAPVYNCGSNAVYTITPDVCYHVLDVNVDGISLGPVTTYTFTNISIDHTITASFELNTSLAAPVISGPKNVCPYLDNITQVTYTATSQGAASFSWLLPPNVTLQSSTANSITVTFNPAFQSQNNKQIRVTALSPCGNSPLSIYYLLAQTPNTPGAIVASSANVCAIIGTAGTITYTISSVAGALSYNWSAQAGTTTINHINGAGPSDTTVTVSFTGGFTSSLISVTATNGCGTSPVRSLMISRVPPSVPSSISGPVNVCANMAPNGTAAAYSVTNTAGTTYNWTVPAGATGVTGLGTSSISFTYPAGFSSGSVSVTATNGCGTSGARTLSVTRLLPSATGNITALETQGCPDRIVHYSVPAMPANATSIAWVVPTGQGAILLTGQGTTAIDVSYPAGPMNSTVTATATNNCGNSVARSINVVLTDCGIGPPPPGPRSGRIAETTTIPAENMQVNVYPNPSVSDFKLQVTTAGKEKISVRISDMQGRQLKQLVVMPNQTNTIGSDLGAGSYIVEVRQGTVVRTVKMIKF